MPIQLLDHVPDGSNIFIVLELNPILIPTTESIIRKAHAERQAAGLLTNDSIIVACMREYGVRFLASSDRDFQRVRGVSVFGPDDL